MKRAKIYIAESSNQENKYNIYRFKNEPAQMELEYYNDIEPIVTLYEDFEGKDIEYGEIGDYVPFVDDKGDDYDFITYSAPFDFVFKQDFIIFHIGGNGRAKADKIIEVYTSKVSASRFVYKEYQNGKFETKFETTNSTEIKNHFMIETPSCVALHKDYTKGYEGNVRLGIHTRRLFFVDAESNGVYNPKYQVVERTKDYELHPITDSQHNIYHYTSIGTTSDGRVSNVSNVASVLLAEEPHKVNVIVECSDDYHNGGNTWTVIDNIKASNAYRIQKDDMYVRDIPDFNIHEIKADDSNIQIYHERILKVPNIWHRDKMNLSYRRLRAYRFKNEYCGEVSEYSDVFYKEDFSKINIDKMVIYKKKVTYLDEEDRAKPIEIGDSDAELLRICVRVGGIYYRDAIDKVDTQPIEILSDNSRFPIINIKDRCLYSNHYNYTVYLYDEKGKQSKPYTVVL